MDWRLDPVDEVGTEASSVGLDTIEAAADTLEYSQISSSSPQGVKERSKARLRWWKKATIWIMKLGKKRRNSVAEIEEEEDQSSLNSVVLPPDLPLEEIAKEVVRLKSEAEKDVEDRRTEVLEEAMKRSDQKWVMLFCFLTALSIGMLSIVAMRIGPM